jgi:hypothetical protein
MAGSVVASVNRVWWVARRTTQQLRIPSDLVRRGRRSCEARVTKESELFRRGCGEEACYVGVLQAAAQENVLEMGTAEVK